MWEITELKTWRFYKLEIFCILVLLLPSPTICHTWREGGKIPDVAVLT